MGPAKGNRRLRDHEGGALLGGDETGAARGQFTTRRGCAVAAANEARIAPNDVSVIGADKAYAKPTLKPISAEAD